MPDTRSESGLLSWLVLRSVLAEVGLLVLALGCGGRSEKPRDPIPEDYAQSCWLTVPRDVATISEAMARTPSTGIVCIEPGIYTDAILLHDGISLRGTGDGVHLCGGVRGLGLTEGVALQRLAIGGSLEIASPATVSLENVTRAYDDRDCLARGRHGVLLDVSRGGTLALTVDGGSFQPDGFWYVGFSSSGPAVELGLSIKNARCVDYCDGFVRFPDTLPPGSSVKALLENDVAATEAPIAGDLELLPDDAARSELRLVHNTFFNLGYAVAIRLGEQSSVPVRLHGNAIAEFSETFERRYDTVDPLEWDEGGNVTYDGNASESPDGRWSDAWWADVDAGDFHPAPGSPLIGAGGENEPGTDALGIARGRWSEAGALEAIGSL